MFSTWLQWNGINVIMLRCKNIKYRTASSPRETRGQCSKTNFQKQKMRQAFKWEMSSDCLAVLYEKLSMQIDMIL